MFTASKMRMPCMPCTWVASPTTGSLFVSLRKLAEPRACAASTIPSGCRKSPGSLLVAQIDDLVVGYSQIISWPEADGIWVYLTLGWVLPEWRARNRHCNAALDRGSYRRLAAAEHPGEKAELAANASSTETEATALLLHEGYRAVYTVLDMALDASSPVPVHPLPAGVEVRPALPDTITSSPTASTSLISASMMRAGSMRIIAPTLIYQLKDPRHDPTSGSCMGWRSGCRPGRAPHRKRRGGGIRVSVRPAWRRRGLARGLLSLALRSVRERGIDVIRLRTVKDFRTRARDCITA